MTTPRRNSPAQEAAFLRAEGRFAVMVGGILLLGGLGLAVVTAAFSLSDALPSWAPAALAVSPVAVGWLTILYAAWRFEQALAVSRGRRPRDLYLRHSAQRLRHEAQARRRAAQAAEPATQPEDQAHWKL
jgi:hypothetical protein